MLKTIVEMTEHYFITQAANEPNAKSAENRQVVVDRYNSRFGDLLVELEELWTECGVNGDLLNERSIRYDKSNWRRAFNQMRTGVNRIIESELQCENCCTETKKQERIKKLVSLCWRITIKNRKRTFWAELWSNTGIFERYFLFGLLNDIWFLTILGPFLDHFWTIFISIKINIFLELESW